MKIKIKKKPRKFEIVIGKKKINIIDIAKIRLKQNEQVTFGHLNSEYDVVKKDWGYYATPSINGRLKKNGFRTFLIENKRKKIYIFLVHKNKMKQFKKYCKDDNQKILTEMTNGNFQILN
tara:strand:+ start:5149 stop:5508 length:360 start_codon:yes stop_codon:yes gene_type:complete